MRKKLTISFKSSKSRNNLSFTNNNSEKQLNKLKKSAEDEVDNAIIELVARSAIQQDDVYDIKLDEKANLQDLKKKINTRAKKVLDSLKAKSTDDIERSTFLEEQRRFNTKFPFYPLCVEIIKSRQGVDIKKSIKGYEIVSEHVENALHFISGVLSFLEKDQVLTTFQKVCDLSQNPYQWRNDIRQEWIVQEDKNLIDFAPDLAQLMWPRSLYEALFSIFSSVDNIERVLKALAGVTLSHIEVMKLIIDCKNSKNKIEKFEKGVEKIRLLISFKALLRAIGCPPDESDGYCSILKGCFDSDPKRTEEVIDLLKGKVSKRNKPSIEMICEIILYVKDISVEQIGEIINTEQSFGEIYSEVLNLNGNKKEADSQSRSSSVYSSDISENNDMVFDNEVKAYYSFPQEDCEDKHSGIKYFYDQYKESEDVDVIDIITCSDKNADALCEKLNIDDPVKLSSPEDSDLNQHNSTSNSKLTVKIGTLAQLVQYESNKEKITTQKRILLLDDADHFLFDNPLVRQTNALTTLGTYTLFPVLRFILNQVNEELSDVQNEYINFTENELIQYLQSTFYNLKPGFTDIRCRLKSFYDDEVFLFPEKISNDQSEKPLKDVFDYKRLLYRNEVETDTKKSLRTSDIPLDTTIIFGKLRQFKEDNQAEKSTKSKERTIWLYFKTEEDLQDYQAESRNRGTTWNRVLKLTKSRSDINWEELKDVSLDTVLSMARKIMNELDKRRNLKNTKDLNSLDEIICYLRYVHLYCFYSQRQYQDLSEMIVNSVNPMLHRVQSYKQDPKKEQFYKCPKEYPYLGGFLNTKNVFSGLIDILLPLPDVFKEYCIEQLDKWVEICYRVVRTSEFKRVSSSDLENSKVKGNNLLDTLIPFDDSQDDEFKQIFQMHNSLKLTPINFANRYTHIKDIFQEYTSVCCFSDVTLAEEESELITNIYKLKIETVNLSRAELPCCQFSPSVIKHHDQWLDVVCKSVACQIRLGKNVFLFCESEYVILTKMLPQLDLTFNGENVDIVTKESDEPENNQYPRIIIATPLSARSINYDFQGHSEVKGNHVCMTFIPSSSMDNSYCLAKRLVGNSNYKNSSQFIIYNETGRSISNCNIYDGYAKHVKNKIESWDLFRQFEDQMVQLSLCDYEEVKPRDIFTKLGSQIERFALNIDYNEISIKSYKHALLHQAHAMWMKRTLRNGDYISSQDRNHRKQLDTDIIDPRSKQTNDSFHENLRVEYDAYVENFDEHLVFLGNQIKALIDYGENIPIDNEEVQKRKEGPDNDGILSSIFKRFRGRNYEQRSILDAFALYYFAFYKLSNKESPSCSDAIKLFKLSENIFRSHIIPIYQMLTKETIANKMLGIIKVVLCKIKAALQALSKVLQDKNNTDLGISVTGINLAQALLMHGPENFNYLKSHCISIGFFGYYQVGVHGEKPGKQDINLDFDNNESNDGAMHRFSFIPQSFPTDNYAYKRRSRRLKSVISTGLRSRSGSMDSGQLNQYDINFDESDIDFEHPISPQRMIRKSLSRTLGRKNSSRSLFGRRSSPRKKWRSSNSKSNIEKKSIERQKSFHWFFARDKQEEAIETFNYKVRKVAALKLSIDEELPVIKKNPDIRDFQKIAAAFKVVIYHSNKFYFPSETDDTTVVPLNLENGQWEIEGVTSFDLYDLFFTLYNCHDVAILY